MTGLGYAFVYSALSLAIPALIARAIDRSLVSYREPLAPLLAAIAALALLRGWVNFRCRYATSRVGIAVEARMRELLYNAYLRFPRAFYDRQPTGQVLSRATNDLHPVRYFIGWGTVQAIQSTMLVVGTSAVQARKGISPMPPTRPSSGSRWCRRSGAARRPADPDLRRGDVEHRPADRAADRARA
ncbi:MAG: ABC transporter transmembrane domain-containing protein [Solirubrobacteraceae bacterium]